MKNYYSIALLIIVSVITVTSISAQAEKDSFFTLMGNTYVRKTIISGKWGKAVGEFGLDGESPTSGPKIFNISPEGIIVVNDAINGRLIFYDDTGSFINTVKLKYTDHDISFDEAGNICIIGTTNENGFWDSNTVNAVMYNYKGILLNTYNISPQLPVIKETDMHFSITPVNNNVVVVVSAGYPIDGKPWTRYDYRNER